MKQNRFSTSSIGQLLNQLSAWPLAGSAEAHTRAEKVRILFRQGPPAQALGIVGAVVVSWALWDITPHWKLYTWCGSIAAVIGARMILALQFQRKDPLPKDMQPWETVFILSLAFVSLIWGIGGWWVMPPESTLHQAVVFFFLLGVAGGVVAAYGAHATAAFVAVLGVMLPSTIAFAFNGAFEARVMAVAGVMYLMSSLRSIRYLATFLRRSFELSFELQEAYAWAKDQARTDELTGLPNRRALMHAGRAAVDQSIRYQRPLSVLVMDIDHFKRINDTHGHAAGDAALRAVADALRSVCRTADTPGRMGGEEFAVLLPETPADVAMVAAERLRKAVADVVVTHGVLTFRFTASVGVAERSEVLGTVDLMLSAADQALYRAKTGGRDRVVCYATDSP